MSVDRKAGVVYGYRVAQIGLFMTPEGLRAKFDAESLAEIVRLMTGGIDSWFKRPGVFCCNICTPRLGRAWNARVEGSDVRADLYLSSKNRWSRYVMDLAESDPGAFGSSLLLTADQYVNDKSVPLWIPTEIYSSDVEDKGYMRETSSMNPPADSPLLWTSRPIQTTAPSIGVYRRAA